MGAMMTAATGIYLTLVGINGKGAQLINSVGEVAGGFIPWVGSLLVLALLYKIPTARDVTKALLALIVITLVLKNEAALSAQFKQLYASTQSGSLFSTSSTSTSAPQQGAAS